MESFREGLRESGYVEGQDIAIDLRYAEAGERLRALAEELVQLNVSVMVAFGDQAPAVAQRATSVVPIVAVADDIVGTGLVRSLARPGGNLTGMTIMSPELSAKRLAVLKELIPRLTRVAVIWDPANRSQLTATEEAARSLSVKLQVLEVRNRDDVPRAFQAARNGRAQALNVLASPLLSSLQESIMDQAASHRLPAIYQWKEHADAGGTRVLWTQPRGNVAASRSHRGQGPQRRKCCHSTRRAAHQVRAGDQHEDRQSSSSEGPTVSSRPSRSHDRMTRPCEPNRRT
jgi:putative ABC transport system substrate-binding protein